MGPVACAAETTAVCPQPEKSKAAARKKVSANECVLAMLALLKRLLWLAEEALLRLPEQKLWDIRISSALERDS